MARQEHTDINAYNSCAMSVTTDHIPKLVDEIASRGYVIIDEFLSPETIALLAAEAKTLHAAGGMKKAGIGKAAEHSNDIRGDFIHWLEEANASPGQQQYLQHMKALRGALNRDLYLGLFNFETHFAIYPPGAGYGRHLDQFQGDNARELSSILYLNQDWQDTDGGELRIYLDETRHQDIAPQGGRLVLFLSAQFWHEVLPARRERISLTGWFRKRPLQERT